MLLSWVENPPKSPHPGDKELPVPYLTGHSTLLNFHLLSNSKDNFGDDSLDNFLGIRDNCPWNFRDKGWLTPPPPP